MAPFKESLVADLVSAVEGHDGEHVSRLLGLGVEPDIIDTASGWSALHASILHNLSALPELLEHSANPNGPLVVGGTPLSYAVHELGEPHTTEREKDLVKAICLLLEFGADPKSGASDQSALELCRLYRMPHIEALLLQKHAP